MHTHSPQAHSAQMRSIQTRFTAGIALSVVLAVSAVFFIPYRDATAQTSARSTADTTMQTTDAVYFNGDILTMEGDSAQYVEAVVVKDGKITFVGATVDAMREATANARQIDLGGKFLMPGFIDSHSHIAALVGTWNAANLSPPPVGPVGNISQLQEVLREYIKRRSIPDGVTVLGNGYDDALLAEHRHPTKEELDAVSTTHPVVILHASGHMGAANSAALRKLGITVDNAKMPGGQFLVDSTTGELTGVFEEQAVFKLMALFPVPTQAEMDTIFTEVLRYYMANGITTAQDGQTLPGDAMLLKRFADSGNLPIDILAYLKWTLFDSTATILGTPIGEYRNHLKIGGAKITEDGSPQARTAFLSQPYYKVPEGYPKTYLGAPIMPYAEFAKYIDRFYRDGIQTIVHCNGDSTAQWFLNATKIAEDQYGRKDVRFTIVHAQTTRHDQIDMARQLGVMITFFPSHVYYWGDWHREVTLGPKRAAHISATGYAYKTGVPFAIHTDAPVVPISQLDALQRAVTRTTRTGFLLGPDERIDVYTGLRALTAWAAYMYHEEDRKGSLRAGKLADFVILDKNPIEVDPNTIRDIVVLETIKEGKSVYKKTPGEKIPTAPFSAR